ncbi:3',5'-cyclic-nucleotide phosphodiesterase [Billgrantia endophytica]|uniref:3',5'-cyclic-nucleotide phosphodiesterase n=1 Tax=Billgrantia endophytica TaxID=2033802 RepID=A0A2N7U6E5_9GAMM|nr:3',5'-cyclic-nucleotide phosphodiesterase [Halomonas endophytica]PMR76004.1 3',5'-cyclic-nucleotide phosphodiesterase [Halomonas endophytica]
MLIEVLGASGGIGRGQGTTALRAGNVLIDAGSGLGELTLEEMRQIRHVFLTHAHLDHTVYLPFLIDSLFDHLVANQGCLEVMALPEVIGTLQRHMFNRKVWPDFSVLPSRRYPVMRFVPLAPWQRVDIGGAGGLGITPFPVSHRVPALGYRVASADLPPFVFSGDTTLDAELVVAFQRLGEIDTLMLECAFPDRHASLAKQSGHMTPALVRQLLGQLAHPPERLWISHLKPAYRGEIEAELIPVLHDYQWTCL